MIPTHRFYAPVVEIIQQLCRRIPQVTTLSIVGSTTRDFVQSPGDIDFLALTDSPLSDTLILANFHRGGYHDFLLGNWIREEDTLRTKWLGISVGVAFVEKNLIEPNIHATLEGQNISPVYKTWAICASVPEVLCADIQDAIAIYDQTRWLAVWKERLLTYPVTLQRSILTMSRRELIIKASIADRSLQVGDTLTAECAIHSSLLPLLRGFFATEKTYFRGMKHLTHQIAKFLPAKTKLLLSLTSASDLSVTQKIGILRMSAEEFHQLSTVDEA